MQRLPLMKSVFEFKYLNLYFMAPVMMDLEKLNQQWSYALFIPQIARIPLKSYQRNGVRNPNANSKESYTGNPRRQRLASLRSNRHRENGSVRPPSSPSNRIDAILAKKEPASAHPRSNTRTCNAGSCRNHKICQISQNNRRLHLRRSPLSPSE